MPVQDQDHFDRQRHPIHRPLHQQKEGCKCNHSFDKACTQALIGHRLIPPRHPQTNGMVERFNGRIAEIVGQTRFPSLAALIDTLHNYVRVYNHSIPQRALKHRTPIQAMKAWQKDKPELFVKRVYDHAGLDT